MATIKTYASPSPSDPYKSIGIHRMEEIYERLKGQPDAPHRHNYYTVILVQQAQGHHVVDFNEYELREAQAWFVSPGQVHQLVESAPSKGFAMVFSSHFLVENNIPLAFIDDLNLFHDYGQSPPLDLSEAQLQQLVEYCAQMEKWHQSANAFKERALGALMELFLISCNNICPTPFDNAHHHEAGNSILKQFEALVEANYQNWHASSQYAEALHITPDHLNRTVKSLIGKTAKEYIQSRITVAAKRMLYFSDQSNKEIGYALGFSEPGNFSAFFKKCTGQSPSDFKARA